MNIDDWIRKLVKGNYSERLLAVQNLEQSGDPRAVEALKTALEDADSDFRIKAQEAFERLEFHIAVAKPKVVAPKTASSSTKETPITSSFLGLVKRGICPVCGAPIAINWGFSSMMLCQNCGDYLEVAEKKLRQMDPTLVTPQPAFAAPTPWTDMQAPRFGAISFDMESAVTEMILTKKEGVRVLDAKWPAVCCVCGKSATREETTTARFIFTPPGLFRLQDKEATVIAKGIPHCAEHKDGTRFERARLSTPEQETIVGLFFRSYTYQIQFRKLNPWKWLG